MIARNSSFILSILNSFLSFSSAFTKPLLRSPPSINRHLPDPSGDNCYNKPYLQCYTKTYSNSSQFILADFLYSCVTDFFVRFKRSLIIAIICFLAYIVTTMNIIQNPRFWKPTRPSIIWQNFTFPWNLFTSEYADKKTSILLTKRCVVFKRQIPDMFVLLKAYTKRTPSKLVSVHV